MLQKSQLWKVHPAGSAGRPDAEGPQIPPSAAGTVYTLYPSPNPHKYSPQIPPPAAGAVYTLYPSSNPEAKVYFSDSVIRNPTP